MIKIFETDSHFDTHLIYSLKQHKKMLYKPIYVSLLIQGNSQIPSSVWYTTVHAYILLYSFHLFLGQSLIYDH